MCASYSTRSISGRPIFGCSFLLGQLGLAADQLVIFFTTRLSGHRLLFAEVCRPHLPLPMFRRKPHPAPTTRWVTAHFACDSVSLTLGLVSLPWVWPLTFFCLEVLQPLTRPPAHPIQSTQP